MPGRRRGFSRGMRPIITSIKNVTVSSAGVLGTIQNILVAKAVTTPNPGVKNDVSHGCIIKAIWISIDFCGLAGTGVLNIIDAYLIKSPGDNLTLPLANAVGGSNEKKFVVKQWEYMAMRNQDGNPPYHWEGWVKLPRRYHRMGTDDTWRIGFSATATLTGHISTQCIYKWYR